jgi:hypothetical protein
MSDITITFFVEERTDPGDAVAEVIRAAITSGRVMGFSVREVHRSQDLGTIAFPALCLVHHQPRQEGSRYCAAIRGAEVTPFDECFYADGSQAVSS